MPKLRVVDVVVQTTTTLLYWHLFHLVRVVQELHDEFDRQALLVIGNKRIPIFQNTVVQKLVLHN